MAKQDKGGDIWNGLSKLARATGRFGNIFTLIFMGNALLIFIIFFLNQLWYIPIIIIVIAVIEIFCGFYLEKKKIESAIEISKERDKNPF